MKTAQEAYEEALAYLDKIDVEPTLKKAEEAINEAVEHGQLVCLVGPMVTKVAEKAAIELEKFGYATSMQHSGKYSEAGDSLINLVLNFKHLPATSRESYQTK